MNFGASVPPAPLPLEKYALISIIYPSLQGAANMGFRTILYPSGETA